MVKQNIQEALKKLQDNKIKNMKKHKMNKWNHRSPKHHSETEHTINREINELRIKIHNIKEVTHDIKKLRKKNETEIQNKIEGHSSRLEQT
jgi:hypothetical protein